MSQDASDVVAQARNTEIPEEMHSMQTEGSLIGSSCHGSITYPYRTLLKDTSFPRCHLMAKPLGNRAETFAQSLSMLGHGNPLWDPIGNLDRPKEQLNSGISIGDVGFLTRDGEFESYFNIFLPSESPAQLRCPPDHIPLDPLLESDIFVNSMQFTPGTTLVSHGIEVATLSSSPMDIKFNVKAREGGILVLPDGASREDLRSTTRIRDYVQRNALKWYKYVNRLWSAVVHPNGTLYVVTGTDKAATWASCVTYTRQTQIHRLWKPPTIIYRGSREDSPHQWEANWEADEELTYKRSRDIEHVGKCALLVRGMRIALNVRDWTDHILGNKLPVEVPFYIIRTVPVLGLRAAIQTLKECRTGYMQMVPAEGGIGIRVIFHPLDVILKLLLEESPSSTIAIVEDHVWCAVADKSDASLASIVRLLVRILETHETFVNEGMITLIAQTSNSEAQAPLTWPRLWLRLPTYIKSHFRTRGQRREILKRLGKIFPGPVVPTKSLRPKRQGD